MRTVSGVAAVLPSLADKLSLESKRQAARRFEMGSFEPLFQPGTDDASSMNEPPVSSNSDGRKRNSQRAELYALK